MVSVLGKGDLQLYMFAMVSRIDATHFWASKHPDGHPEEVLMNHAEAGPPVWHRRMRWETGKPTSAELARVTEPFGSFGLVEYTSRIFEYDPASRKARIMLM